MLATKKSTGVTLREKEEGSEGSVLCIWNSRIDITRITEKGHQHSQKKVRFLHETSHLHWVSHPQWVRWFKEFSFSDIIYKNMATTTCKRAVSFTSFTLCKQELLSFPAFHFHFEKYSYEYGKSYQKHIGKKSLPNRWKFCQIPLSPKSLRIFKLYITTTPGVQLPFLPLLCQPSFPVIHKVGNVNIFVLPKFEKYDR